MKILMLQRWLKAVPTSLTEVLMHFDGKATPLIAEAEAC